MSGGLRWLAGVAGTVALAAGGVAAAGSASATIPPGALGCYQGGPNANNVVICMWANHPDCEGWVAHETASGQYIAGGAGCQWFDRGALTPFDNPAGYGGSILPRR